LRPAAKGTDCEAVLARLAITAASSCTSANGRLNPSIVVHRCSVPERGLSTIQAMTGRLRSRIIACLALSVALIAPAARAQTSGYVTTSDSARLFYRIIGRGPDTLVAIHGGPGMDLESIYGDFAVLGARHVVIFYDQRGGGKSELPADTTRLVAQRQIQDLDDLRKHFKLAKVTLIAHSYGPLLAASYALAHPDKVERMVFFGPVPPYRGDFAARYGTALNARLDDTQRAAMRTASRIQNDSTSSEAAARQACRDYWALGLRPRLADPDRTSRLVKSDICASDIAGIRYGSRIGNRVIMGSFGDWDLRPQLRTLQTPLLVVHGEAETIPMDMVEAWATSMPRATLLKVPNAAHFPYAERPEFVWPAVEKFLSGK
jgi:proline iminopeptidase